MESRSASLSLEVRPSVDHIGKSQSDLDTKTPIVEDKAVLQSVDIKSDSLFGELGKRKRRTELGNGSCSVASPLKNYENFMKSGLLSRLLYHDGGEWIDFPKEVMELARKEFQMKHAVFEVEWYDSRFILDIMFMMKLDINTGTQKNIAWIDDAGSCFFPELYEYHDTYQHDSYVKPIARDISLHIQIELNGFGANVLERNVENLRDGKKNRVEKSQNGCKCDGASNYNTEICNSGLGVGFAMDCVSYSNLSSSTVKVSRSLRKDMDIIKVHEMFRVGMGCLSCSIVTTNKVFSIKLMENHLELFDTLVMHTAKHRGSANVRYAWLPCAGKDVSTISSYGLGVGRLPCVASYGYGVHLSSENHAYISVNNCDDDENGMRHMLLCRVVLGTVEPVHLGSDQFCPSSEQFDTGVDNISNPRVYVIWEMNAATHIYPECIVSFKLTPRSEARDVALQMETNDASAVQVDHKLQFGSSNACGCTAVLRPNSLHGPTSPWMAFPVLFNAITKKVPPNTMHLVYHHYYAFKCKKSISRGEFVKRLRMIVGDALLKSIITSLQFELQSPAHPNPKNSKYQSRNVKLDVVA